jgi:Fe-S cluster biogenesis protein NfuA
MKVPVTIYAEMTPNPRAMKFVANILLVNSDKIFEYHSAAETETSPLARVLFTFPFIEGIMISHNFVTINVVPNLDWNDVVLEVREYLTNYIQAGQPILSENALETTEKIEETKEEVLPSLPKPGEVRDIDKKIQHILHEYVSPAIESDGGAVTFVSFDDGELKVRLSGSCNGCPSSTQTLQYGIQNIFGKLLPQVKKVSSV